MKVDVTMLSSRCRVRRMDDADADAITELCRGNPQFYRYCAERPTLEQTLDDLHIAPPGVGPEDKYFVGFYLGETLAAVMDLIDGYPEPDAAYIGFFMVAQELQGRGLGTELIREASEYLRSAGKTAIRLAINKGNPQSTHFWKKNGFCVIKEVDRNGWPILVAEKTL